MVSPFEVAWSVLKGDPNLIQQPGDAHSGSIQPVVAQMIDRTSGMGNTGGGLSIGHQNWGGYNYSPTRQRGSPSHYAPYDTPGTQVVRTDGAEAWRAPHFDVLSPDEAYSPRRQFDDPNTGDNMEGRMPKETTHRGTHPTQAEIDRANDVNRVRVKNFLQRA